MQCARLTGWPLMPAFTALFSGGKGKRKWILGRILTIWNTEAPKLLYWYRNKTHYLGLFSLWVTEKGKSWWLVGKKSESEVTQSCPTLCDPMDRSLPGSAVHGIFQARVLEWVAISFSRGSSQPRDWTWVSHTAGRHFTTWATREASVGKKGGK